jgi:hypothetical protein
MQNDNKNNHSDDGNFGFDVVIQSMSIEKVVSRHKNC